MNNKFYLNRFILIFLAAHAFVYLSWAFVDLSLTIPITETFKYSNSRFCYLVFMFVVFVSGAPFYFPFEEDDNK